MGEEARFSAAEAAVYDRQMRLWGVEAQKRLQSSHVLVSGLAAVGAELVKNLVLSGMNLTVHDAAPVTPDDVASQFFFAQQDLGQNRAEASLARVRDLNPLVTVESETRPLEQLSDDDIKRFTVVCLVGATQAVERRFDAVCRAHGIAFFTARTFGFDGVVFADLARHSYRRTPSGENAAPSEPVVVEFPSLQDAEQVQWASLQSTRKRGPQIPRVFIKSQLLQNYRSAHGVGAISADHADAFVGFAQQQLEAQGLAADFFSADELATLATVAEVDLVPVTAIVAGILGQEVIKAISQKDEPICNYFFFDGEAGTVRRIG